MTALFLPISGADLLPAQLTALGIDSVKRAMIASGAWLRRANNDSLNLDIGTSSPFYNSVQFAFSPPPAPALNDGGASRIGAVLIQAKIWYKILDVLESCFDLENHLYPYSNYIVHPRLDPLPAFVPNQPGLATTFTFTGGEQSYSVQLPEKYYSSIALPALHSNIKNLEELFYWSCKQYLLDLILRPSDSTFITKDAISITPFDNDGFIEIQATIPFVWDIWLHCNNLLLAL